LLGLADCRFLSWATIGFPLRLQQIGAFLMPKKEATELKQHPLSAAFPAMSQTEIESLAEDIKTNGQRENGSIFEDMILDGWHRYQACKLAGAVFYSKPLGELEDPVAFVKSRNFHRRHMTDSQKAQSVVQLAKWAERGARPEAIAGVQTNAQMATEAGVSERTIRDAKAAQKAGLAKQVVDGEISVGVAARIGKKPKLAKAVSEGKKTAKDAAKESLPPPKKPEPQEDHEYGAAPVPTIEDFARDLEDSHKENTRLTALVASLSKSDLAAEIKSWHTKFDQLNGRVVQLTTTANEAKKQAQYYADMLAKIRKFVGCEKNTQILATLMARATA
jgi:hypothetical protein